MKKQWMQMTSLVLNCVLIVLVFWQGARLDDLELEMRRGLNGLETATRSETASVASGWSGSWMSGRGSLQITS